VEKLNCSEHLTNSRRGNPEVSTDFSVNLMSEQAGSASSASSIISRAMDLDVHRKIANLGEKTFLWENGAKSFEVKFNYTLNAPAVQLLQICEGLARQQELLELLQRRMKCDRLGVNDALMQFETDLKKGVFPETLRGLPLLDQIAGNSRFVEIARQRARTLAERIRHSG
jgi:hypothetical protein